MIKVTVKDDAGETLDTAQAETLHDFVPILRDKAVAMHSSVRPLEVGANLTRASLLKTFARLWKVQEVNVMVEGGYSPLAQELIGVAGELERMDDLLARRDELIVQCAREGALTRGEIAEIAGIKYPRVMQILRPKK